MHDSGQAVDGANHPYGASASLDRAAHKGELAVSADLNGGDVVLYLADQRRVQAPHMIHPHAQRVPVIRESRYRCVWASSPASKLPGWTCHAAGVD